MVKEGNDVTHGTVTNVTILSWIFFFFKLTLNTVDQWLKINVELLL